MFELVMSKGFIVFFSSVMIYIISLFLMMPAYDGVKKILEKKKIEMKIGKAAVFVVSTPLVAVIYIAMSAFVNWGENIS